MPSETVQSCVSIDGLKALSQKALNLSDPSIGYQRLPIVPLDNCDKSSVSDHVFGSIRTTIFSFLIATPFSVGDSCETNFYAFCVVPDKGKSSP